MPSARAVNFTMNRKAIRDLAAKELGLKTAKYFYAKSLEELQEAAKRLVSLCGETFDVFIRQRPVFGQERG